VVVEVGGGLRTYRVAGVDILDGYAEDERATAGRGQPLIPWPNRLDGGRYAFDGVEEQAPINEPALANAIHGLTRWLSWDLVDSGTDFAAMALRLHPQPGWAWTLDLRIEYRLVEAGLDVRLAARNRSATRCPFGAGFHPYLAAPSGRVDDLELTVPAASRWLTDDRNLPTAKVPVEGTDADFRNPRALRATVLDTAFTDLRRDATGMASVEVSDRRSGTSVKVRMDAAWTHVMIFTGDTLGARARQGLAVEPMSGPANSMRTGEGLIVIDPGERWEGGWAITPSSLG
jgi:aldose 1-epimerase